MNTKAVWMFTASLAVALTGLISSGFSQTQAENSTARRPNRPERPAREALAGQGGMLGRFMPGLERLMGVLTEEQRSSLREAMEGQRDKLREWEEKLRDTRRELFEAGLIGKFDEQEVRAKATEAAKAEAELMVLRAKAFSQMRPPLTAEQIEKVRSAGPPGRPNDQSETPRRRSNKPRDENDLPQKESAPAKNP